MYKIREVAQMAHVSVRTLHHYDEIGLLRPDSTSPVGYRIYSEANAKQLREILFYKAVGFDLMQIKDLLQQPEEERRGQLVSRRQRVTDLRQHLQKVIQAMDVALDDLQDGNTPPYQALCTHLQMEERTDMDDATLSVEPAVHRQLAADLFNATWELMDKSDRTTIEDERMIHTAHASRYHWDRVGQPVHFARGEWLISRAYTLVQCGESALRHAAASLRWCSEHDLGAFDRGFAHEAMARAHGVLDAVALRDTQLELAIQAAQGVEAEADRDWLLKNIQSVPSLSVPDWE